LELRAQETIVVHPDQLDSLKQLIEKSREDTNKVILLNEYALLCFYDLEFLNGLSAVKEARDLSRKLKYANGEIAYYKTISHFHRHNTLGEYYLIISDWRSNEGIPRDALSGASTHPEGIYDDDLDRAQNQLIRAFDSFKNKGDEEITADILFEIFQNYGDKDDPEMAFIYWELAYNKFDSLGQLFPRLLLLIEKITYLRSTNEVDSARQLELRAINLADKTEDLKLRGLMFFVIGNHYLFTQGRFNLALEYYLKSADALDEVEGGLLYMQLINLLGFTYGWSGNNEKSIYYLEKDLHYYQNFVNSGENLSEGIEQQMVWVYTNIAGPLIAMKRFEEADSYLEQALLIAVKYNAPIPHGRYYQSKAKIANEKSNYDEGLAYNLLAMKQFEKVSVSPFLSEVSRSIAQHYQRSGEFEKALQYAVEAYKWGLRSNRANNAIDASLTLSEIYEQASQTQKANEFLKIHVNLRDEYDALNASKRFEDAELRSLLESRNREIADLEKNRLIQEQERQNQRLWIFSISGALITAIFLTIILYRNAQSRKMANVILNQQKQEIENTLSQLQATQTQLIQSEKMASLGELTAGIAHEIQNPLNFVNNFSDLNSELVEELREEVEKGNMQEAKAIINDIKENEGKILHHGKRADGIVKGMLQHSRTGGGEKEPTDINALADEYLRLAYHGLRAKDKSFNADFKTELDPDLPKVNVVPQDIGRVLLNLINNAFYAVFTKAASDPEPVEGRDADSKSHASTSSALSQSDYKPTVILSTKRVDSPLGAGGSGGSIEISIKDNGPGIPDDIKDKIFQPFFTTKATGEGTGLGLSLSYDIVNKGHGGTIDVKSKEGEGSEFLIILPA
jgi:signal transduction histidine kinase